MPVQFKHSGICVGTLTPMKENGDINLDVIPQYAEYLINAKVNAVFVNGTTSEGLSLSNEERKQLAEKWIQTAKGKLKVIVHCGAVALRDAQELAKHAEKCGADAIASIPSFYFPPRTVQELVRSVAEIASSAPDIPFIYYHSPRTHVDLDIASFMLLAKEKIPNFAGIKWATSNAADAYKCVTKINNDDVTVMWAEDDTILGALSMGISSFNGSSYSITAPYAHKIIEAYEKNDGKSADISQIKMKQIVDLLEKNGNWLQRTKAAVSMIGLPMGPTRLPVQMLDASEHKELEQELRDMGLLHSCR
ncbi:N-acetylneuraminate lyase-like [Paramacrobiotus metropolitanus]|uniref:N-acetylneuraminate lyase-like n=1 Tax=Paramacrobiotus metropolitanus TaxID=2943436 RepID=UPI00244627EC|nr:N-acetylneuraminate lyase-like [Paramacrobiotus metropolitanus]